MSHGNTSGHASACTCAGVTSAALTSAACSASSCSLAVATAKQKTFLNLLHGSTRRATAHATANAHQTNMINENMASVETLSNRTIESSGRHDVFFCGSVQSHSRRRSPRWQVTCTCETANAPWPWLELRAVPACGEGASGAARFCCISASAADSSRGAVSGAASAAGTAVSSAAAAAARPVPFGGASRAASTA